MAHQMARSSCTGATDDRTSPNAGPDSTRSECQPGGHSIARQTSVLRRWLRMERLEYRFSKLRICLICTVGITLGGAQRNPLSQAEASCSTQLCYIVVILRKGTALTRVVNAGAQEGLDAWRAQVLHHEPTSLTRNARLLQVLWTVAMDRDVDRCEKTSGENFPNNIRIGFALRMQPDRPLKQHVVLKSARLTTWEALKAEIDNVRRALAAACSTSQPMDLSAYGTQGLDAFQKGQPDVTRKGQRQKQPQ